MEQYPPYATQGDVFKLHEYVPVEMQMATPPHPYGNDSNCFGDASHAVIAEQTNFGSYTTMYGTETHFSQRALPGNDVSATGLPDDNTYSAPSSATQSSTNTSGAQPLVGITPIIRPRRKLTDEQKRYIIASQEAKKMAGTAFKYNAGSLMQGVCILDVPMHDEWAPILCPRHMVPLSEPQLGVIAFNNNQKPVLACFKFCSHMGCNHYHCINCNTPFDSEKEGTDEMATCPTRECVAHTIALCTILAGNGLLCNHRMQLAVFTNQNSVDGSQFSYKLYRWKCRTGAQYHANAVSIRIANELLSRQQRALSDVPDGAFDWTRAQIGEVIKWPPRPKLWAKMFCAYHPKSIVVDFLDEFWLPMGRFAHLMRCSINECNQRHCCVCNYPFVHPEGLSPDTVPKCGGAAECAGNSNLLNTICGKPLMKGGCCNCKLSVAYRSQKDRYTLFVVTCPESRVHISIR